VKYDRTPSSHRTTDSDEKSAAAAEDHAGRLLRRLLPFPASGTPLTLLDALPLSGMRSSAGEMGAITAAPAAAARAVQDLVSTAASILDDEMAKGVISARDAGGAPGAGSRQPGGDVLRQVHELVDNLAGLWPGLQRASYPQPGVSQPASNDADPLAELKPWATVRPGQRATISMSLCNKESRPVHLVPASTDLLGSGGGRIAASLLAFTPTEVDLEPQAQKEMEIAVTVPADATAGCYSGVLVVRGVPYLRALLTIEVT
jgi:hypothetical protein